MIQLAPAAASSTGAVPPGMPRQAATNFCKVTMSPASAVSVRDGDWNRARFARFEPATAGDFEGSSRRLLPTPSRCSLNSAVLLVPSVTAAMETGPRPGLLIQRSPLAGTIRPLHELSIAGPP